MKSFQVFERGWLSSNNILFISDEQTALVDTGYCTHSDQTLALVKTALKERPLDLIVNTHIHSDHCGGNAALQAAYPLVCTRIPPGESAAIGLWDSAALSFDVTGQNCPRFTFSDTLSIGENLRLGYDVWQVLAAPGHDPHSVVLFEPVSRTLISADALWQNGFGVVFPELDGVAAFAEVTRTLDLIQSLNVQSVIPGHGSVFGNTTDTPHAVQTALDVAYRRIDGFIKEPLKHAKYAVKVLLKYKLLELQRLPETDFMTWALNTPNFEVIRARYFSEHTLLELVQEFTNELVAQGAAHCSMQDGVVWLENA